MAIDRMRDLLVGLRDLDLSDVGVWPRPAKAMALAVGFCGTILAGQVFYLSAKQDGVDSRVAAEAGLKKEYARKALPAGRLESVRQRHENATAEFESLLRQLPGDTEVPGLIDDISRAALTNGLTIGSIDLEEEQPTGFYTELPIRIAVRGGYHDIGAFVSDVAALSRIVILHDFDIAPDEGSDPARCARDAPQRPHCSDTSTLGMAILAKTYSYVPRAEGDTGART